MNAAQDKNWPLVDPDDHGIRPAGKPDACFYCSSVVGTEHARDCVIVTKRVKVRYTLEIEVDVPYAWNKEFFEFHRNESSWCADNVVDEITAYVERLDSEGGCVCDNFKAEFISVTDGTPKRKIANSD